MTTDEGPRPPWITTEVAAQMRNRTLGYIRKGKAVCYACAPKTLKFWTPVVQGDCLICMCDKCRKVF